jgi:hypothetical protein
VFGKTVQNAIESTLELTPRRFKKTDPTFCKSAWLKESITYSTHTVSPEEFVIVPVELQDITVDDC